jgi:hypothetical protein
MTLKPIFNTTQIIKKFQPSESIAKIKVILDKYFENIGRGELEDNPSDMNDLIEDIDKIIKETDVPNRELIVARMDEYNQNQDKFKGII